MSRVSLARSLGLGLGQAWRFGLLVAWLGGAAATERPLSAVPADAAAQRQAIAAEKAMVERRFNSDKLACQHRFQVNDCVAQAKVERRHAISRLQQQSLQLDEAQRRHKAALRLQLQQQRQADAAAQAASAAARPQRSMARTGGLVNADDSANAANTPVQAAAPAVQSAASRAQLHSQEQRRLAQYNDRLAAARAHQQALEARNADQQGKRPAAAVLPVPVASSPPR